MAVEHNFARGDILRKVLDRAGLVAKRPLNLIRGGADQAAGAELLRRARLFSQHAAMLSSKLDDLIEFKEDEKQPPSKILIESRRAGTLTGGLLGIYGGSLLGAEHGSLSSGITGAKEGVEKFTQYAKEDAARARRKNAERYQMIEDEYGGTKRYLKSGPKIAEAEPIKGRARSVAAKVGKVAKELPTRTKYATEDILHGTGKWLTRSSLSRSAAGGALAGAAIGRYLGSRTGRALEKAQTRKSKELREARIRRQATDIARAHVQARAMIEGLKKQNLLSAKLDELINFAAAKYATKYPKEVLESSWRRLAKPSRKTFGSMLKRHDPRGRLPQMIFRDLHGPKTQQFSVLDTIIEGAKAAGKGLLSYVRQYPVASAAGAGVLGAALARKQKQKQTVIVNTPRANQLSVLLDDVIAFQDPRPRNLQGEFAPQGSGGPDPNAMATVYKMPQPQGSGIAQGAGAALVGGALGAVGGNIGKTGWAASRRAIKHLAARRKGVSTIIHP